MVPRRQATQGEPEEVVQHLIQVAMWTREQAVCRAHAIDTAQFPHQDGAVHQNGAAQKDGTEQQGGDEHKVAQLPHMPCAEQRAVEHLFGVAPECAVSDIQHIVTVAEHKDGAAHEDSAKHKVGEEHKLEPEFEVAATQAPVAVEHDDMFEVLLAPVSKHGSIVDNMGVGLALPTLSLDDDPLTEMPDEVQELIPEKVPNVPSTSS